MEMLLENIWLLFINNVIKLYPDTNSKLLSVGIKSSKTYTYRRVVLVIFNFTKLFIHPNVKNKDFGNAIKFIHMGWQANITRKSRHFLI